MIISGRSSREFQQRNPNALTWVSLLDQEGEYLSKYIVDHNWERGASIIWNDYFGEQFHAGIENSLRKIRPAFKLTRIAIDPAKTLSSSEVQKMLNGNPQVVFLMTSEDQATFTVNQLKTLGYKGVIVLQSSMIYSSDPTVRAPFKDTFQQHFLFDRPRFISLREKVSQTLGVKEVAADFVFSYDGFKDLLESAEACKKEKLASFNTCIEQSLRDGRERKGVSGTYRFMKDGSTERPMEVGAFALEP